jgi:hypothetical protein
MRRLVMVVGAAVLVACCPAVASAQTTPGSAFATSRPFAVPQVATYTFGQQPLTDVKAAANAQTKCGGLSNNMLTTMMLAPTYPETGASGALAPSPMTLSRYDTASGLYAFGNPSTTYPKAFWNPGVGAWQFDSAGGWSMTTAQEIRTDTAAAQVAKILATGWCNASGTAAARRAAAWSPWHGCGPTGATCESIYQTIYSTTTLHVTADASVTRLGGAVVRSCQLKGGAPTACTRVDPSLAQGDDAFASPGFGPSPISAPFYDLVSGSTEYRVWLSNDTGYQVTVWASLHIGSNARTSLTWGTGPVLCDLVSQNGCAWTGWQAFPQKWYGHPAVATNADGRLEVFATGFDGVVYHSWQTSPNGIWSAWKALPGLTTARSVVAVRGIGARMVATARLANGSVSVSSYSGTAWSGWSSIGGAVTGSLSPATNPQGRAEVFGLGTSGAIVHAWQTSTGAWSGWASLGAPPGSPATALQAVMNASGRLEVFVVGGWATIYHAWQLQAGGWSGWAQLGGNVSGGVSVGTNATGRLEVFYRGADGALWHLWQSPSLVWSAPASLGGALAGAPVATRNRDGRLEVFAPLANRIPGHIWQKSPSGSWSGWGSFGGPPAAALVATPQADGHLVLFDTGTDTVIHRNLQLA